MAPSEEIESPTLRLGGARSVRLSYEGMCKFFCDLLMIRIEHSFFLGGDCIIRYATRTEDELLSDYTMIFHNKQKTSL